MQIFLKITICQSFINLHKQYLKHLAMKLSFNAIFKNALPYGLILGSVLVVLSLLMYIFNVNIFSIWFSILNFLVMVLTIPVTMVLLGTSNLRVKFAPDKKINYGQALLSCFLILVIGFTISILYSYIFNNLIDPGYITRNIDKFSEMMRGYNLSEEKIAEQVKKIQEGMGTVKQIIYSAGICVVLSLILALIVRKKDKIADSMI